MGVQLNFSFLEGLDHDELHLNWIQRDGIEEGKSAANLSRSLNKAFLKAAKVIQVAYQNPDWAKKEIQIFARDVRNPRLQHLLERLGFQKIEASRDFRYRLATLTILDPTSSPNREKE